MSYCCIVKFYNGIPKEEIGFDNSWGGAARIWDAMWSKYIRNPQSTYYREDEDDLWLLSENGVDTLFQLIKYPDIPFHEKAVIGCTADYVVVSNENFGVFAYHLKEFDEKNPRDDNNKVNHLPKWAETLENCDADYIGFNHTSVSESLWFLYDEDKDEEIPYNLNENNNHMELYDELNNYTSSND